MAEALTASLILKALAVPAHDIYELGKAKLHTQLQQLRNEKSLKALARRLQRIEKVKTFWSDNKEVVISSFYYPSKIVDDESDPVTVSSLAEFPQGHYCFVIEGTVGQGKSIFMRYLAAQELRREKDSRIPVFAELRFLQPEESLESFIFGALEASGLRASRELFELYAQSGKVVLFLDAFDEIDQSLVKRTIRDLERLAGLYPHLSIIVSARPQSGIQHASAFHVVKLAPLTKRDHRPFVLQLTNSEDQTASILKATSKSSASIDGLLTTPLLLTLIVILYAAQQHIPNSVAEFYSELFDVLFYKHDRTKSGFVRKRHVDVGEQKIKRLFEGVCFYSTLKQYRSFKADQFASCVEHACKHVAVEVEVGKFRDELVKTACLLKEEGQELSFIHKSVQEFYAAAFVARSADAFAQRFYSAVREESTRLFGNWAQPLAFLSEIDEWRYAKFYWLEFAQEMARHCGLSADEMFSPTYTMTLDEFGKLTSGMSAGAVFEKGAQVSDWHAPYLLEAGPLFTGLTPLISVAYAAFPSGGADLAIESGAEEKLKALSRYLVSQLQTLKFGKGGSKQVKLKYEGITITINNVSEPRFFAFIGLMEFLNFVDAPSSRLEQTTKAIRQLAVQREKFKRLIRAEEEKSKLLELMI